jgi:DNA-directed RNA polymerase II subunit RPB1
MNCHVIQSIGGRVEVMEIMASKRQIISRQGSAPVTGSVQNTLIGMFILTNNDFKIDISDAMDLVCQGNFPLDRWRDLLDRAQEFYPDMFDENRRFKNGKIDGKILASIVIPREVTWSRTTKTNEARPVFKVKKGIILPDSGPMCKKVIGVSSNNLVHLLWKSPFSPSTSCKFISECQYIGCRFIWREGFSIGAIDCVPTKTDVIQDALQNALIECEMINASGKTAVEKEIEINGALNKAMNVAPRLAKTCMNRGMDNALVVMKIAGAKGNDNNNGQISGFVGQQNIDGTRVPLKLCDNTRSLPHFNSGDNSPKARGFVQHSYMQGLTPTEMWFHCVSGRRGVTDTHNKTQESGYISKKMNKKMEDYVQHFNGAVYDTNGNIITFLYGGDGFNAKHLSDVTAPSSSNLKQTPFPFFVDIKNMANYINTKYELENPIVSLSEKKRPMSADEIEELLDTINVGSYKTEVTTFATHNIRLILKSFLKFENVYESQIYNFCTSIQDSFEFAKSEHGESVGLIAGFSLGQPTTQMTLNTFQSAGVSAKDVTLGLPWLKELINASENQTRRNCTVYLKDGRIQEIQARRSALETEARLEDVTVSSQLVAHIENEELLMAHQVAEEFLTLPLSDFIIATSLKYLPSERIENKMESMMKTCLVTYEDYSEEWWITLAKDLDLVDASAFNPAGWVIELSLNVEKLHTYHVSLDDVCTSIQEQSNDKHKETVLICIPSPLAVGKIQVFCNFEKMNAFIRSKIDMPIHGVERSLFEDYDLNYLTTRDVVLDFLKSVELDGVEGIESVTVSKNDSDSQWIVNTLGTNLKSVLASDNIIFEKTISNDMYEIFRVLGIEAARMFLRKEITKVLCFDGTYINSRHISLLVDAMTRRGMITSVTRDGVKADASVLGRCMFEVPVANLSASSVFGEKDPMNSMSASIMMGTTANTGMSKTQVYDIDKLPARKRYTRT